MIERILLPLDGSRFARRALPYATEIARRFGAEIIVMRVISPAAIVAGSFPAQGDPYSAQMMAEQGQREYERERSQGQRYLAGVVRGLKKEGVKASYQLYSGGPAASILQYCKRGEIDLIVMTTRGRSGLKRAILGSVTDEVLRESGVPTLVVTAGRGRSTSS